MVHLSAGDLLRAEAASDSEVGGLRMRACARACDNWCAGNLRGVLLKQPRSGARTGERRLERAGRPLLCSLMLPHTSDEPPSYICCAPGVAGLGAHAQGQ